MIGPSAVHFDLCPDPAEALFLLEENEDISVWGKTHIFTKKMLGGYLVTPVCSAHILLRYSPTVSPESTWSG